MVAGILSRLADLKSKGIKSHRIIAVPPIYVNNVDIDIAKI